MLKQMQKLHAKKLHPEDVKACLSECLIKLLYKARVYFKDKKGYLKSLGEKY